MSIMVGKSKVTQLEVISLKKSDAGWKMLLNSEIEGMAQKLKEAFGTEK